MMKVKVKKLTEEAIVPKYATVGSACFDLHTYHGGELSEENGQKCVFGTGLSFEIPEGYQMLVFSRSGHGFNSDVRLANCVAVIDSDFRGEVKVKLSRDNNLGTLSFNKGDRIAQAQIIPVQYVEFEEVYELSETVRGEGGFGSTGVR